MESVNSNLFISYKQLKAKTAPQLEKLMLRLQVASRKPVSFTAPTFNSISKQYETWYLHDFSNDIRPKEQLEIGSK